MATAGTAQVMLTWNASTGATGYYANRATKSGGPYTPLAGTAATNFIDTGLTSGTTYYYVITAYDSAGVSANSAEVSATPLAVPTGLTATPGNAKVALAWNAVTGATSYNAKRSLTTGGPYSAAASPTTNSYTDTGVTNGTKYYYVVTAVYASGESANTAEVSATPTPPVVGKAAVDFGTSLQTIRGFGGSSAWIMNMDAAQADALYGNSGSWQIGLSILRVRIDPSGYPNIPPNWATELNNAQRASARGAIVFATPWSPPAAMKDNNNVNNGGSLKPANYGNYANYLESFVTYMQNGGVPLHAISMQNEPDWTATYESCRWTAAQMDTWVADNSSVLTTRLMMPESTSFNPARSDPALNDPNGVGRIAIIAGHLYGSAPFYYANAVNNGKDVWMTEHSFSDTGLAGALKLAKEVHDSMTVASYNAYLWWWLQNWNGGNYRNGLIDDPTEDNHITLNGYAMAQFSKFVRPGYVRSAATNNPSTNIHVSAYKGSGHYVIVAINLGIDDVSQPFAIQNQTVTSMTPYQTSTTENLAQLDVVGVTSNSFTYTLPAQSITTFVD